MPKPLKITICGGDKRYIKTYQLFSKNGFETSYTNTENLKDLSTTDVLILPIASFDREGILTGSQYSIYVILNMIKSPFAKTMGLYYYSYTLTFFINIYIIR